jgi:periplasmic protein TonB
MSYVDQGMVSQGRVWSIVLVAILHALLGYAFVTGLAYKFVKNVQEDLKTFDVEEPPPPEEEPPPPPKQEYEPPPVTAPPPIVRTFTPPAPISAPPPPPIVVPRPPTIVPPPPPPPPPPPRTVEPARARTNLASYVSNDDYPASALRNEEEGTTRFRLTVGTNGRVTDCSVTSSSGSAALDSATCRIMRSRARFTPARDNQGNPTTDTYTSSITWRIQD